MKKLADLVTIAFGVLVIGTVSLVYALLRYGNLTNLTVTHSLLFLILGLAILYWHVTRELFRSMSRSKD